MVKTFNGTFWYDPPVQGLSDQKIDDDESHILANQPLTFTACFKNDLPL